MSDEAATTSVRIWDDRKKTLLDQGAVVEKLGVVTVAAVEPSLPS